MWALGLFLAVPLIEIVLFVTLGGALGLVNTLAFIIASAMLGFYLLRRSAVSVQSPSSVRQLAGSGFSLLSSFLLIAPGFFSSFLGLVLLVPLVQRALVATIGQRFLARGFTFSTAPGRDDGVIDGNFTVVEQSQDDNLPPSKWTRH